MTRKSKLEAKQSKKRYKPLVVEAMDDENFNWLHSMRTPEEKERDREEMKQSEKAPGQQGLEEEVRREREEISKANQASALQRKTQHLT